MRITVYANALPRSDNHKDGGGSTTNRVTKLRSQSGVSLSQDIRDGTWSHHNADRAGDVTAAPGTPVTDRAELARLVGDIVQDASRLDGILELDLEGSRSFVVPGHHWPTFQIVAT